MCDNGNVYIFYPILRNKTKNSPFKFFEPIKNFSFSPNFM